MLTGTHGSEDNSVDTSAVPKRNEPTMDGSTATATAAGFLLQVFSEPKLFRRGGIAVFTFLLACWLGVFGLLWMFQRFAPAVTVKVNETGAVVISNLKSGKLDKRTSFLLLSANGGNDSPWIDTGLVVQTGDKVRVRASGKVCLAFHRMRDSASNDTLPPLPWIDPNGLRGASTFPPRQVRDEERERAQYLLAPGIPQGKLIGLITDDIPEHDVPQSEIVSLGSDCSFSANRVGKLWLTVNDIWLDRNRSAAYCGNGQHTEREFKAKIVDNRYWNIWYDDNAGSFLVTIEIIES